MSVGPAEDYEHQMDAADAAEPTRPSDRGAWRRPRTTESDEDLGDVPITG